MDVRVNLQRSEYLDRCIKDKIISIKGQILHQLELQALHECTGVVKRRQRPTKSVNYYGQFQFEENGSKCKKYNKRRDSRSKKKVNGVNGDHEQSSSSMSRDDMEKDLKIFVDKYKLQENGQNIDSIKQATSIVFNGKKVEAPVVRPPKTLDDLLLRPSSSKNPDSSCLSEKNLMQIRNDVVPTREDIQGMAKDVDCLRAEFEELKRLEEDCSNQIESEDEDNEFLKEFQIKLDKTISLHSFILTSCKGSMQILETIGNGETVIVHQTIEGCAGIIPFTLKLLIQRQNKDSIPLKNAKIVDLDLIIPKQPIIQKELEPFIEKMGRCRDMYLCMKGLETYTTWMSYREKTFSFFDQTYSPIARLTSDVCGRELLINNPRNCVKVVIIWKFKVGENGCVTPDISLKVNKSKMEKSLDNDSVLSKLPKMFKLMVEVYGVERSIQIVIDMLCT